MFSKMEAHVVKTVFAVLVSCMQVSGGIGPPYSMICHRDADCTAPGTLCYRDYLGCDSGLCGCRYGKAQDGSCILKDQGDTCQSRDQCARGLDCHMGQCTCTGQMIDKNNYCLKEFERLAGDRCGSGQICLHKKEGSIDYSSNDVTCMDGACSCRRGLKRDGSTCRRHRPEEYGCVTNADCSGDSVCTSTQVCTCPSGHKVVTDGKCGRTNARTGIGEGRNCDEIINKDKFCANSLECIRCGDDFGFKCRKYKSSRPEVVGSSSVCHRASTLLLVILFTLNTLSRLNLL